MSYTEDQRRALAADVVARRRALKVNAGIYVRRNAPRLLPMLTDTIRSTFLAQTARLGSEQPWRPGDDQRLAALANDIARFAKFRPELADTCEWHADRLRELTRQYAVLARLEAQCRPSQVWPTAKRRKDVPIRWRAPVQAKTCNLRN